jgi:hypothetical protein
MLLMLTRYRHQQLTGIVPKLPTVNDVERMSPLAQRPAPKGLTFGNLISLAKDLGWTAIYHNGLVASVIMNYIDNNVPVGVLVEYDHILPNDPFNGAHFIVIKGYNDQNFLTNDPYHGGENLIVSKIAMNEAMKSVVNNNLGYQGITL